MKVALLMGSFNPVHNGHLGIARYVVEHGLADEVWFVVSPQNPFKDPADLAPFGDRLKMVELAIAESGCKQLKACDVERDLPQPSYTINTVRLLTNKFPVYQFIILAGSDISEQLHKWKDVEELKKMVQLLFYSRQGGEASPELAGAPQFDIDATRIRESFSKGYQGAVVVKQTDALPSTVIEYIYNKKLYDMKEKIKKLNEMIKNEPGEPKHYYERGRAHYQYNDFGKAANDFAAVLELDPNHAAARQMKEMIDAIFSFRNFHAYNH